MANDPASMSPVRNSIRSLPRRQLVITMAGVLLAMFLASLDQTIVGTAMPRIIEDLGGFTQYTWPATAYLIASTVTVPIVGKLTDMYGRKWFYVGGLLVFIIGSGLCGDGLMGAVERSGRWRNRRPGSDHRRGHPQPFVEELFIAGDQPLGPRALGGHEPAGSQGFLDALFNVAVEGVLLEVL